MSKAAHTPIPWRSSESMRGHLGDDEKNMDRFYSIMQDVQGNGPDACIAEAEHGSSTYKFHDESLNHEITLDVAKANAELIILAVNNHQVLLGALRMAANTISHMLEDEYYSKASVNIDLHKIEELIKKLTP